MSRIVAAPSGAGDRAAAAPADRLAPMCGIVGYVGEKQAQDVVIEGLRRLEYRGYDSAGIALVARRGAASPTRRPASSPTSRRRSAEHPLPASTTGIGHTRWATHGAPNDVNAHPHLGRHGRVARRAQRDHRELRRSCALELEADGHELLSETDTEVAAHLLERELEARCRPDRGDAARLPAARGRVHAGRRRRPRPVARRRRPPQLPAGRRARRRRELPRLRRGGVHRAHPRGARARPGPGRHDHPRRGRGHRLRRHARRRARRYHVDWDLSAAEKDGHDWFMRKEIFEQPRAVADSLLGRRTAGGQLQLDEMRLSDAGAARHRQDHHHRVRHVVLRRAWWPSTRSSTGPGSRARSSWPRSSATATRSSTQRHAGRRDQPVGRDRRHPDGDPARARRSGSQVLAICNTNGSTIPRESDAVIYTHAGPEIGVASTKGFLTQLVACYLLALYLAQVRGTRYGDEIAEVVARARADARPHRRRSSTREDAIYALAARARGRAVGAVPRPARRLPGRARGRAQAQGAGLHPRRGLRGRRAQARADRADRGGAAGVLRRAARRAATSCTTR